MMNEALRLLQDPEMFPSERLALLRRVSDQAARLKMSAYVVGGVVRDLLLARAVDEIDVVVEGDAIKLARALAPAGDKVTAHPKFGTASVAVDGTLLDLTTARSESYERPGALPVVKFGSIDEDLRRRDFTMNAMAIRLDGTHLGELLDPLQGRADLAAKRIRVLHERSFVDDPTRMLRAVRYAERYGFAIEPETLQLFNAEARGVLSSLSGERLRHELDVVFEEQEPAAILRRLAELDLLTPIHSSLSTFNGEPPMLQAPPADWGSFKSPHILSMRQTLGWISWLQALKPAEIQSIAERLAFPLLLSEAVSAASALAAELDSLKNSRPSQWTARLDRSPALSVYAVYLESQSSVLKDYLSKWRHVRQQTTGDALKARGLPEGPRYQEILSTLRAARLDGQVSTDQQEQSLLEKLLKDS